MTETYQERVARFRIIRHEELPPEHKASLRLHGIDPDDNWSLIWSFDEEAPAQKQLADCIANACSFQTYKLVDAGEATTITRSAWL
jgi:hypothetical protein